MYNLSYIFGSIAVHGIIFVPCQRFLLLMAAANFLCSSIYSVSVQCEHFTLFFVIVHYSHLCI